MKFQENPLQTVGNMRAQICQYSQKNVWTTGRHPRPQGYPVFLNVMSCSPDNLHADQMDWRLWGQGSAKATVRNFDH